MEVLKRRNSIENTRRRVSGRTERLKSSSALERSRIEQLHFKDSARAISEQRKFRREWEERTSGLSPVAYP